LAVAEAAVCISSIFLPLGEILHHKTVLHEGFLKTANTAASAVFFLLAVYQVDHFGR
jgi:hypothetical protein